MKRMRWLIAVALVAAACGGNATDGGGEGGGGSTGDPQRGGTMDLVALNDLATLDNSQAVTGIDYNMVAGALYEGLYHFTPEGVLEVGLADGLPEVSADGLVYTITIKEGALFAGPDFEPRPVTAADAAFGMVRALDPNTKPAPSWGSGYLFPIAGAAEFAAGEADSVTGITVVDDRTLQITLTQPNSTFIYGLTIATSWPVPQEAVEARGEGFGDSPVGAGPFYVQEWNKGADITLARNPGYVDPDLPYLDGFTVDLGVDENTIALRLQAGEADGVFEQFALSPEAVRQVQQDPNLRVTESVGPRIYYLALNNDGIFGNLDLRLAVAHAATRDFVTQFGDLAKPWNQLMSSTSVQSDPSGTTNYPTDAATAAEYLASGGYDGTPVKIVYDVTDPYGSANATALKQDLEAVGFVVDLQGLQQSEFFSAIYDPTAFDISSTYWSADYPDAQDFFSTNFVCASIDILNIARFCDESIDEAFYATDAMPFGADRDAALRAVQQRWIDAVAGVPMMEITPKVILGPRVGDIPTLATYAPFDWKRAWLLAGA